MKGRQVQLDSTDDFVHRFTIAWAQKDPHKLQALFHPDAVVRQSPVRRPFAGSEVATYFARVFAAMPTIALEPLTWTASDEVVMIEWRITASTPDGEVAWHGVDRFKLRDGRAYDESVYFDTMPLWETLDPSLGQRELISLD